MKLALLVGMAVLLAVPQASTTTVGQRKAWSIKKAGTTIVTTHLGGEELTVTIHTWTVPVDDSGSGLNQPYPDCTYTQNPCSIADWIHIRMGTKTVAVRTDGIAGLGDMHYLSIAGSPPRLMLVIAGGDGADGYVAQLLFDRLRLVERRVYGIDKQHPVEVSHYYYTNIG